MNVRQHPLSSQLALTDSVSHAGTPTFLDEASFLKPSYTERIRGGAGSVFGRANGALMSAFSEGDNFDMLMCVLPAQISTKHCACSPPLPNLFRTVVLARRFCKRSYHVVRCRGVSSEASAKKEVPAQGQGPPLALTSHLKSTGCMHPSVQPYTKQENCLLIPTALPINTSRGKPCSCLIGWGSRKMGRYLHVLSWKSDSKIGDSEVLQLTLSIPRNHLPRMLPLIYLLHVPHPLFFI